MSADARDILDARTVRELRRVLPREERSGFDRESLPELLARISGRRVPASSFARTWIMGSLHAKIAAGYLAYWMRGLFADSDAKARLNGEARLAAALELFGAMGYLRGAVMKIGQLLANLPEVVPEEFAEVLAALHFEAPPMHYSMVREVFLDEFGREPEDVFASFDRQAFAAASLGQVHRARLDTGEEVAVKIQYPDIARACLFDDPAEMEPDRLATLRRNMDWNFEPWLTEGPFDFGDVDFYRRGIDGLVAVARKRYTRTPPLHLWTSRFIFGSRALAYRLKGRCDFRQLHRQEYPGPAAP
ncbi:MAG: AarF/ABC1/UbiB kinase family protein [Deltaproteobacteria bacterium]|nr:AarF/ABC1/UbiB kinase family protein [Deltaproteobacteria bacterium]